MELTQQVIGECKQMVAIRVRPLIQREISQQCEEQWAITETDIVCRRNRQSSFVFDRVIGPEETNKDVFDYMVKHTVQDVMHGINGTLFAYGQTSSGKTYTMMGDKDKQRGVINYAVEAVFSSIERQPNRRFLTRFCYMEIYNEEVMDLLTGATNLKIREQDGEVYPDGITEEIVQSPQEIYKLMDTGDKRRHVGSTNMNEMSSRSHAIAKIVVESISADDSELKGGAVLVSHLNFVDLAGSEKPSQSGAVGQRLKEGSHINTSLFALANCVTKLAEKSTFVPYRDSKLTRLLQNSLGGNARTGIVCCVTPAAIDETLSTLRFGSRAKRISSKPVINEVLDDKTMIRRKEKRIKDLEALLAQRELETLDEEHQAKQELMEKEIKNLRQMLFGEEHRTVVVEKKLRDRRMTWAPQPGARASIDFNLTTMSEGASTDEWTSEINRASSSFRKPAPPGSFNRRRKSILPSQLAETCESIVEVDPEEVASKKSKMDDLSNTSSDRETELRKQVESLKVQLKSKEEEHDEDRTKLEELELENEVLKHKINMQSSQENEDVQKLTTKNNKLKEELQQLQTSLSAALLEPERLNQEINSLKTELEKDGCLTEQVMTLTMELTTLKASYDELINSVATDVLSGEVARETSTQTITKLKEQLASLQSQLAQAEAVQSVSSLAPIATKGFDALEEQIELQEQLEQDLHDKTAENYRIKQRSMKLEERLSQLEKEYAELQEFQRLESDVYAGRTPGQVREVRLRSEIASLRDANEGTIKYMEEELTKTKTDNERMKSQILVLEERLSDMENASSDSPVPYQKRVKFGTPAPLAFKKSRHSLRRSVVTPFAKSSLVERSPIKKEDGKQDTPPFLNTPGIHINLSDEELLSTDLGASDIDSPALTTPFTDQLANLDTTTPSTANNSPAQSMSCERLPALNLMDMSTDSPILLPVLTQPKLKEDTDLLYISPPDDLLVPSVPASAQKSGCLRCAHLNLKTVSVEVGTNTEQSSTTDLSTSLQLETNTVSVNTSLDDPKSHEISFNINAAIVESTDVSINTSSIDYLDQAIQANVVQSYDQSMNTSIIAEVIPQVQEVSTNTPVGALIDASTNTEIVTILHTSMNTSVIEPANAFIDTGLIVSETRATNTSVAMCDQSMNTSNLPTSEFVANTSALHPNHEMLIGTTLTPSNFSMRHDSKLRLEDSSPDENTSGLMCDFDMDLETPVAKTAQKQGQDDDVKVTELRDSLKDITQICDFDMDLETPLKTTFSALSTRGSRALPDRTFMRELDDTILGVVKTAQKQGQDDDVKVTELQDSLRDITQMILFLQERIKAQIQEIEQLSDDKKGLLEQVDDLSQHLDTFQVSKTRLEGELSTKCDQIEALKLELTQSEELKYKLQMDVTMKSEQIDQLQTHNAVLKATIERTRDQLEVKSKELAEVEERMREIERSSSRRVQELGTEMNLLKHQLAEAEENNGEMELSSSLLQAEITKLKQQLANVEEKNVEMEVRSSLLQAESAKLKQQLDQLQTHNAVLEATIECARDQLEVKSNELAKVEESREEIERSSSRHVQELRTEMNQLKHQLAESEEKNGEMELSSSLLQAESTKLKQQLANVEKKNGEMELSSSLLQAESTKLKQQLAEAKKKNEEIELSSSLLQAEINGLKQQIEQLKKCDATKTEDCKVSDEDIANLKAEHKRYKEKARQISIYYEANKKELARLRFALTGCMEQLDNPDGEVKRYKELKEAADQSRIKSQAELDQLDRQFRLLGEEYFGQEEDWEDWNLLEAKIREHLPKSLKEKTLKEHGPPRDIDISPWVDVPDDEKGVLLPMERQGYNKKIVALEAHNTHLELELMKAQKLQKSVDKYSSDLHKLSVNYDAVNKKLKYTTDLLEKTEAELKVRKQAQEAASSSHQYQLASESLHLSRNTLPEDSLLARMRVKEKEMQQCQTSMALQEAKKKYDVLTERYKNLKSDYRDLETKHKKLADKYFALKDRKPIPPSDRYSSLLSSDKQLLSPQRVNVSPSPRTPAKPNPASDHKAEPGSAQRSIPCNQDNPEANETADVTCAQQ